MRIQQFSVLFISFIALLLVIGCADNQKTATDNKETISPATAAAEIQEVTLNVTGMTWGGCSSKVQAALAQVPGVKEVISVSNSENKAVVKVEKGKVTNAALTSAVEGAGSYRAKVVE